MPPPQRNRTHKRASASISMVADKVFGFFTTTKTVSPNSSPQRQSSIARIPENEAAKDLIRSNTKTRQSSVLGGVQGATVLAKKNQNQSRSSSHSSNPHSQPDMYGSHKSR